MRRHFDFVVGERNLLQDDNDLGGNSLNLNPAPLFGSRSLDRRKVRECYNPHVYVSR